MSALSGVDQAKALKVSVEVTGSTIQLLIGNQSPSSYSEALLIVAQRFGLDGALLFYKNSRGGFTAARLGRKDWISIPEGEWRLIKDALDDPVRASAMAAWSWPAEGFAYGHCLSRKLAQEGESYGYIVLGRDAGEWGEYECVLLSTMASSLSPVFAARYRLEMNEAARLEAESQLRRNERRLREFFEESRDMIYTADGEDLFISINAAGARMLGRDAPEDVLGRRFSEFTLNASDRGNFLAKIKAEGHVEDYEIIIKRGDGTTRYCVESSRAFRPAGGEMEIQGLVKDISERIEAERTLWKATMELTEANDSLQKTQALMIQQEKMASIGQLTAGVAHEINNPLGFLLSNHRTLEVYARDFRSAWTELAALAPEKAGQIAERHDLAYKFDEMGEMIAQSNEGFDRIMHIISNMKTFARMDPANVISDFNLNDGIESTLVVLQNEIKYVADVAKDFGTLPLIRACANEINQVILNILVNASQAIEGQGRQGRGRISISTRAEGEWVVCDIEDDGPGIPAEYVSRVFDPFFTTKEPGKGTGLGLSISYDIVVNKHGGKLIVSSEPGKGSAFRIELPLRSARE